MSRILLVDDDKELCELLRELLELEGFELDICHDGVSALEQLAQQHYDVIVLDVMMPRLNGFDTLRELRSRTTTPVLMMTARGDEVDRIVGFEVGADDYLPKPCNPRELIARLNAILRRVKMEQSSHQQSASADILSCGPLQLHPATQSAQLGDTALELTQTEFGLLQRLLEQPGVLVSKEQLMQQVLQRRLGPFDRSIDMHISNLRKKLGEHPQAPSIRTVRGRGYLLTATQEDGQ